MEVLHDFDSPQNAPLSVDYLMLHKFNVYSEEYLICPKFCNIQNAENNPSCYLPKLEI
jgi:hypothetical protein